MDKNIQSLEQQIFQLVSGIASSLSINPMIAKIYALLYFSNEPLSLEEIAKRTKVSKASASVYLRILESWNAVKEVYPHSNRKDFYVAEPDILKIVVTRIEEGLNKRLNMMNTELDGILNKFDEIEKNNKDNKTLKKYKEKIKEFIKIKEKIETSLKLLPKLKQFFSL